MAEIEKRARERFWAFSLDRYRRPGVAEICLSMQDEASVDVNLLLFCLWCDQEGITLTAQEIAALDKGGAGEWREQVVRPLRAARRAMKTPPSAFDPEETERLRTVLKRVEIESERLQQTVLAEVAEAMDLLAKADPSAPSAASAYIRSLPAADAALGRLNALVRLTLDEVPSSAGRS